MSLEALKMQWRLATPRMALRSSISIEQLVRRTMDIYEKIGATCRSEPLAQASIPEDRGASLNRLLQEHVPLCTICKGTN